MYGKGENEWSIPYEIRKEWFKESVLYKWPPLDKPKPNKSKPIIKPKRRLR
jgi:hypothetical protein